MTYQPQLLVSVRSREELQQLVEDPPDIIDLKEPNLGPLAPAKPEVWQLAHQFLSLAQYIQSPRPMIVSAALGESSDAFQRAPDVPSTFRFAKMGPSGLDRQQLADAWAELLSRLPSPVELVAVSYADHEAAQTASPIEVLREAEAMGIRRVLLDTFIKDGRSSLRHLGVSGLGEFASQAREAGIWWALAGSLELSDLQQICQDFQPDCVGLRGAVCVGDRTQRLSMERVRTWNQAIKTAAEI